MYVRFISLCKCSMHGCGINVGRGKEGSRPGSLSKTVKMLCRPCIHGEICSAYQVNWILLITSSVKIKIRPKVLSFMIYYAKGGPMTYRIKARNLPHDIRSESAESNLELCNCFPYLLRLCLHIGYRLSQFFQASSFILGCLR